MLRLTEEQIQNIVFENSLNTCDYISGYETSQSIVKIKCRIHQYEFETKWGNINRKDRAHHLCPYCQKNDRNIKSLKNKIEVECAYCHTKFFKLNSRIENSKSGLYFCCRKHKDLAQRIDSGQEFQKMRPDHYGSGNNNYRERAFREYPNKCAICGYNEDIDILQVHHIDENRQNNKIDNLIILCPNCHAKITYGNYILKERKELIKNN